MTRRRAIVVGLLVLALQAVLLVRASRHDAVTFDEPAFISGGLAAWTRGDYRLSPDGSALPMRLQGLPLALAGVKLPDDPPAWRTSDAYALGHDLLYRADRSPAEVLLLARLPIAACGVALAALCWLIARKLFGEWGGLLTLALVALNPVILAHAHLATADLVASLAFLAATWCAGLALEELTPRRLALSCLATGLAFIAKMSAVLLIPIVLVIALGRALARAPWPVRFGRRRDASRPLPRVAAVAGLIAVHAVAAMAIIWAVHGFRYSALAQDEPGASLKFGGFEGLPKDSAAGRAVEVARAHRLLPEAWLFGFQYVVDHAQARRSYAEGRWSMTGFWWFFPRALMLKLPIGTIALVVVGLVAIAVSWRRRAGPTWPALLPLLALVGVYMGVALVTKLNVGVRHVLPAIPPMLVLAGAAATLRGRARVLVAILVGIASLEGLASHPDHLAWMNATAGRPAHRWTHLVDSSLDWGQGLWALRDRLAREPADASRPVRLAYFGSGDPNLEGLRVTGLPSFNDTWRTFDASLPRGGLYAFGATMLVQLHTHRCPGRWRAEYEDEWQRSEAMVRPLREARGDDYRLLIESRSAKDWSRLLLTHDDLMEGRLAAYLRHREPDEAVAGGAILLWRLTDEDVNQALFGPPAELADGPPPFPRADY